ncbi:DUF5701 family protein [Streptomyces sp. URMC 123]|uniref:DUF5701 family protein n=1 Tax=Streptomyces sp. URMC 123 TaxID=3423403 RepID=UPI003F1BDDAD
MTDDRNTTHFDAGAEFDRQLRTLLDKGYPAVAGMAPGTFRDLAAPLRAVAVERAAGMAPPTAARVPFVLVVRKELVPSERAMELTELRGKTGFADFEPEDIARFRAIEEVEVPAEPVYLAFDLDRGEETRDLAPDDAMEIIRGRGRTPITVDEGIAFVTQFPASLARNACFSLVASRCGDRRVPALWISKGAPKLGWCWAGNPHTWLGSATAGARLGGGGLEPRGA